VVELVDGCWAIVLFQFHGLESKTERLVGDGVVTVAGRPVGGEQGRLAPHVWWWTNGPGDVIVGTL